MRQAIATSQPLARWKERLWAGLCCRTIWLHERGRITLAFHTAVRDNLRTFSLAGAALNKLPPHGSFAPLLP